VQLDDKIYVCQYKAEWDLSWVEGKDVQARVKGKMIYYGISESLIKRIIRFPKRREEGIAPGTTAVMTPTSNKKNPQEIWVMYQTAAKKATEIPNDKFQMTKPKVKIISAWRYPGVSPVGKRIPIPDEILQELEGVID